MRVSRKILLIYNLKIVNPALALEWHPTRNGKLLPSGVTPGSDKKVWWLCRRNHEWRVRIADRSKGSGCPYCGGRKACKDNCLAVLYSDLVKEWYFRRNGNLTPEDVRPNSGKKVWWICKKGHEWKARVADRTAGYGCPYCTRQKVCKNNCIETIRPDLAAEWHPTKNGKLSPRDVVFGSTKKVWWRCKKGHEWKAIINSRSQNHGCPYCTRQKVCKDNCLQTVNSALAQEWHPSLNGRLTPRDVTPGSGKKVWWRCNWYHEWEATVVNRNRGRGCPYCWRRLKWGI